MEKSLVEYIAETFGVDSDFVIVFEEGDYLIVNVSGDDLLANRSGREMKGIKRIVSDAIAKEFNKKAIISFGELSELSGIENLILSQLKARHNNIPIPFISLVKRDGKEFDLVVVFGEGVDRCVVSRLYRDIECAARDVLSGVGYELANVVDGDRSDAVVSHVSLLMFLKVHQPDSPIMVRNRLMQIGFQYLDNKKLNHLFDQLRIKKFVVIVEKNENDPLLWKYALTGKGLAAIPLKRNRGSTDILRALALGKGF